MRITYQTFSNAVNTFIIQNVMPGMQNPFGRWALAGISGTGVLTGPAVINAMRMVGVGDAEGVDIDKMESFMASAFAVQPALFVFGLPGPIEKGDADRLIAFLRQQPAIPEMPKQPTQNPQEQPAQEKPQNVAPLSQR